MVKKDHRESVFYWNKLSNWNSLAYLGLNCSTSGLLTKILATLKLMALSFSVK